MATIKEAMLGIKLQELAEAKISAYEAGKSHEYWDKFKRHLDYNPKQIGLWFEIAIAYILGYVWREDGFTFRAEFDAALDASGVDARLRHFGRVIDLQLKYGYDNGHKATDAYTVLWMPGMTPRHLFAQMKFDLLFKEWGDQWFKLNADEYETVKYILVDLNRMWQIRQLYCDNALDNELKIKNK